MYYTSCFLMGGLGNQLFQIFTTIAYANRTRRRLIFTHSDRLTTGTVRSTYWDTLLSRLKMFTTFNEKYGLTNDDIHRNFYRHNESGFHYQEISPLYDETNVLLCGYYQSYKYFSKYLSSILSMIQLEHQQNSIKRKLNLVHSSSTITVHFRLGDYKDIQGFHPLMSLTYYKNALSEVIRVRGVDHCMRVLYLCQAEDNAIVSEYIRTLNALWPNIVFEKVDDSIPDWEQMLIMSCCRDNIIANSTFSWWGAFLNQNPDKVVCYPSQWFGVKLEKHDTKDLFPEDWRCVSVN